MDALKKLQGYYFFVALVSLFTLFLGMRFIPLRVLEIYFVFVLYLGFVNSSGLARLYLSFFTLFVGSPIILDLFSIIEINRFMVFIDITFDENTIKTSILLYSMSLLVFSFFTRRPRQDWSPYLPLKFARTAWFLALLCLATIMPYYFERITLVVDNGYEFLFKDSYGDKSIITAILEQLFFAFSFIAIYSDRMKAKKRFLSTLGIYIVVELLTGRRGLAISILVANGYLLYDFGNTKRVDISLVITAALGAYLMEYIGSIRHGQFLEEAAPNVLLSFIISQGTSFYLLPLAIRHNIEAGFLTLFSESIEPFWKLFKKVQTTNIELSDVVQEIQYSGYLLANEIDPSIVDNGRSWGTSALLEFYIVFGAIGVGLVAVVLAIFLNFKFTSTVAKSVALLILPFVLYSVRSGWLSFVRLRWLSVVIVVLWVITCRNGTSRSKNT